MGGQKSFALWRDHITLSDEVMVSFEEKRRQMGHKPYSSIHVRNTDYTCDFASLDVSGVDTNVYVATDDQKVVHYFQRILEGHSVYNFTVFPDKNNNKPQKNLHTNECVDGATRFVDALHDLLFLAESTEILSNSKGGYIRLARQLHAHRKTNPEISWSDH
jgi:hypothetical protein